MDVMINILFKETLDDKENNVKFSKVCNYLYS